MAIIAILGSERLRKEKSNAISILVKQGHKIHDICQDYSLHKSNSRALGLIETADLVYVLSDDKIDIATAIKIGAAFAKDIPVVASSAIQQADFKEYLMGVSPPSSLDKYIKIICL